MTEETLTTTLAEQVMGWKAAPGRFIKSGRSWITRWHFQPLVEIKDAFQLLDQAASQYSLECDQKGTFTASVLIHSRRGKATGQMKARVISLAVAVALGLEVNHGQE